MLLAASIQAANRSNYSDSWRHPDTELGFLKEGELHLAFNDDRLALPNRYGGSFKESVRHGV